MRDDVDQINAQNYGILAQDFAASPFAPALLSWHLLLRVHVEYMLQNSFPLIHLRSDLVGPPWFEKQHRLSTVDFLRHPL